jgi:hypothetical protein
VNKTDSNSTTRNCAARQFFTILLFLLLAARPAAAASVTLAWTPSANPAVTGFIIYYGTASRAYSQSLTVGNVTNATITGLTDGTAYFFSATTYDAGGRQSDFSQEVVYQIPALPVTPVVTNTTPVPPPQTNTVPVVTNAPVDPSALPTLDPVTDISLRASSTLRSIVLTGLGGGKGHIVSVTADSSDSALVGAPVFRGGSSGNAGTLIFKTATNAVGSAVITVIVRSDAADNNTFTRSFTVNVLPGNVSANLRAPTFARRPMIVSKVAGKLGSAAKLNGISLAGVNGTLLPLRNISDATTDISPAATLSELKRAANGNFTFAVTGIPGGQYVVETSSDLMHWTAAATNTAPFIFEDTATAQNAKRFYRASYEAAQ